MDVFHIIGNDLVLDADNDLALVSGVDETNQRLLRRLLTLQKSYMWHINFGASVPKYIGEPLSLEVVNQLKSDIKAAIFEDDSVAKSPAPEIKFETLLTGFSCSITYHNLDADKLQTLSFEVTV